MVTVICGGTISVGIMFRRSIKINKIWYCMISYYREREREREWERTKDFIVKLWEEDSQHEHHLCQIQDTKVYIYTEY